MAKIIRTEVTLHNSVQEAFNEKFTTFIKEKTGLDWYSLSSKDKYLVFSKVVKSCKRCDNCDMFPKILPRYNPDPKLLLVSRAVTNKDIKTLEILSEAHPTYSIIKKIAQSFNISVQDCYYTNISLCGSPKVNSLTESNFKQCSLYKELEFSSITLPKVIILLGNDAFNIFFGKNVSVNSILGNAYIAEYFGEERLFIPLPHPVTLLRDEELYKDSFTVVNYYSDMVVKLVGQENSRVR